MSTQTDIVPDSDISGAASLSGVEIMNLLVGLQAAEGMAFIIVSADEPDEVSNPRFKRYLWYKTGEKKFYDFTNGTSWALSAFGAVALTDIANGLITVAKLDGTSTANFVISTNGSSTGATWASVINLISNGTLALVKLSPGAASSFLRTIGGIPDWSTIATVAADINTAIPAYTVDKLSGKQNFSLLQVNGSGVASFDTWANFFDATLPGNTIKLPKIHGGAAGNGQGLLWVSATNQWTPAEVSKRIGATALYPVSAGLTTTLIAHGLVDGGGTKITPRHYQGVLVSKAGTLGYTISDEVPFEFCYYGIAGYNPPGSMWANVDNIGVVFKADAIYIPNKTTGVMDLIVKTDWEFKVYYV